MKYIQKGKEPEELKEYKKQQCVCYKTMSKVKAVRNKVRQALIEEQGYICCYCGARIEKEKNTSIEHFLPKEEFPYLDLHYSNLHAVCGGGRKEREEEKEKVLKLTKREKNKEYPLYCDAFKDDRIISLSPLEENVEEQFWYDEDGKIYGITDEAKEAVKKLHLDNKVLNNKRKSIIKDYLSEEFEQFTPEQWEEEIMLLKQRNQEGKFLPFCFVARRYIEEFKL